MPSGRRVVLRETGSLDGLVAVVALALGFSLVGLVLIVGFPLVALISGVWITLRHLCQAPSRG